MYAVIETVDKHGDKEVATISMKWIQGSKVFWPDKKYSRTLLENHTLPDKSWTEHSFKLLSSNIGTISEAKKRERMFEMFSNSESESAYENSRNKKFKSIDLNETFNDISTQGATEIIEDESHANKTKAAESDYLQNTESLSTVIMDNQTYQVEDIVLQCVDNDDQLANSNLGLVVRCNATLTNEESNDISGPTKQTIELTNEIKHLRGKIEQMENTIANFNELLPEFLSYIRKNSKKAIEKDASFIVPVLPIKTVNAVDAFNLQLMNKTFAEQMLLFLKKEVDGKKITKNIRNIIEKLFELSIIHKYTWTGAVNIAKEKKKLSFSELTNVVKLVEDTINYRFSELGYEISKTDLRKSFVDFLKRAAERFRYSEKKLTVDC